MADDHESDVRSEKSGGRSVREQDDVEVRSMKSYHGSNRGSIRDSIHGSHRGSSAGVEDVDDHPAEDDKPFAEEDDVPNVQEERGYTEENIVDENELEPELVELDDDGANPVDVIKEEDTEETEGLDDAGGIRQVEESGENDEDNNGQFPEPEMKTDEVFPGEREEESLISTRIVEEAEEEEDQEEAVANYSEGQQGRGSLVSDDTERRLSLRRASGAGSLVPEDTERRLSLRRASNGSVHSVRSGAGADLETSVVSPRPLVSSYSNRSAAGEAFNNEQVEEEQDEELSEPSPPPQITRERLIERYHAALEQRQHIQDKNNLLQHRLSDYFRRRKVDDGQEYRGGSNDQEQKYLKIMAALDDKKRESQRNVAAYHDEIDRLLVQCEGKQREVAAEIETLNEMKRQTAVAVVSNRSGRAVMEKQIETYLEKDARLEAEVVAVRLKNIKLKNQLQKKESMLRAKEELAEGLHMIDFEQLKIENQTYNEKIEERNEDLMKLRKKITSTVEVLTHIKEKLQFVQSRNEVEKQQLYELEEQVARNRDVLSRVKQVRDGFRVDNHRLSEKGGLLGNEPLLADYEARADESSELHDRLNRLKVKHAELTLNLSGVRRKIVETKFG